AAFSGYLFALYQLRLASSDGGRVLGPPDALDLLFDAECHQDGGRTRIGSFAASRQASLEARSTGREHQMRRRTFLAVSAATLALPSVGHPESRRVLKFIPLSDLAAVDPVWTTHIVTLSHSYMVFDTLYGQSGYEDGFKITPQMLVGHSVEDDGK